MEKIYDVLILGGGVAGMSAAVYAKRSGKSVLLIEQQALGGQVNQLPVIENFPSQEKIDGFSLAQMFVKQVKGLNVDIVYDTILKADALSKEKVLKGKKAEYVGHSLIIASGLSSVSLGKNEDEFFGRGVSYCAICDGNFFRNQSVCVASKKGSGLAEANILSKLCSSVTVLDSKDMSVFAQANKNEKIKVISNVVIKKIEGQSQVEKILFSTNDGEQEIDAKALFIALGKVPATKLFDGQIKLDEKGFILTDENMQTSANNVFAVGDVRAGVLKQIVSACSDGAIAGANCT